MPRPAFRPIRLALAATVLVASGVCAQGVYKVVAPDGRVTYADVPPATLAPNGRVDVMRAGPGPSLVAPIPPESTALPQPARAAIATRRAGGAPAGVAQLPVSTSATTAATGASGAATTLAARATSAAASPSTGALESAIADVLFAADRVRRTESACVGVLPASARAIGAVAHGWSRRNQLTVGLAQRALRRAFDGDRRMLIEEGARRRNESVFDQLAASDVPMQATWCELSVRDIADGGLDVHDKPQVAGPLAQTSPR